MFSCCVKTDVADPASSPVSKKKQSTTQPPLLVVSPSPVPPPTRADIAEESSRSTANPLLFTDERDGEVPVQGPSTDATSKDTDTHSGSEEESPGDRFAIARRPMSPMIGAGGLGRRKRSACTTGSPAKSSTGGRSEFDTSVRSTGTGESQDGGDADFFSTDSRSFGDFGPTLFPIVASPGARATQNRRPSFGPTPGMATAARRASTSISFAGEEALFGTASLPTNASPDDILQLEAPVRRRSVTGRVGSPRHGTR